MRRERGIPLLALDLGDEFLDRRDNARTQLEARWPPRLRFGDFPHGAPHQRAPHPPRWYTKTTRRVATSPAIAMPSPAKRKGERATLLRAAMAWPPVRSCRPSRAKGLGIEDQRTGIASGHSLAPTRRGAPHHLPQFTQDPSRRGAREPEPGARFPSTPASPATTSPIVEEATSTVR